ncbi:MAG: deoxyguanosinetriphosphate triphosphohydrolase [Actinomycetaceae bacterium]|nr:deoxyguanosinetriphosphate triphosphohydrolase [Actinomycetaceae bacterium]
MAYSTFDTERHVVEAPKSMRRTQFERDRARVLHSSALRRLAHKTQVLGPIGNDFSRTRLTHSLEVAQVGRTLGQELGCDPDLVDAACLSHDIGHPPFGHNGERALNEVSTDCGGFEGNAQTFRLLTRLEPKVVHEDEPAGLNLTRAALDAVLKYPWQKDGGPHGKNSPKYSVYEDDFPVFAWVRGEVEGCRRPLETQVMDLSDDIAYSVHDIEDAIDGGRLPLAQLASPREQQKYFETTRRWYGSKVSEDELGAAFDRLATSDFWLQEYDGTYAAKARLKDMTSQLIGRFCGAAHDATRAKYGMGELNRYDADLVIPPQVWAEIQLLKGLAAHYVMEPREAEPVYFSQRTTIFDLVDALYETGAQHLEVPFQQAWRKAENDQEKLRVVVDQVASLTDVSANQLHARLCGMLSGVDL